MVLAGTLADNTLDGDDNQPAVARCMTLQLLAFILQLACHHLLPGLCYHMWSPGRDPSAVSSMS
jgi:hypothetical protein